MPHDLNAQNDALSEGYGPGPVVETPSASVITGGLFGGEPIAAEHSKHDVSDPVPIEEFESAPAYAPDGITAEYVTDESEEETEDDDEEDHKPGIAQLRPYQNDTIVSALTHFNGIPEKDDKGKAKRDTKGRKIFAIPPVRSTLGVLATGLGKSVIISDYSRRIESWGHGHIILVHRDELVRQLVESLGRVGIAGLVEKGGESAIGGFGMMSKTVVASVQTLQGQRLKRWDPALVKFITIDEAHHAVSPSYANIFDHFNMSRLFGLTGTDDRLDGKNLGQVFESCCYEYNLRDAIHAQPVPWLVPLDVHMVQLDPPIDLSSLRVSSSSGDFNQADLDKTIQENVGALVNSIVQNNLLGERRTIVFTPDVASAKAVAYALNDLGVTAEAVWGSCPNRQDIIQRHKAGQFQAIVNCQLLTEGYDDPQLSCVVLLNPTKSRSLFAQMCGRVTRPYPNPYENIKENGRVIDFAYLTGKHKLVSAVDLYDNSEVPDEVLEIATELVQSGEIKDLDQAIGLAYEQFELEERVKIEKRVVNARVVSFDPVNCSELLGINFKKHENAWNDTKPATPKMIAYLRKRGVQAPDTMPFGAARKMISAFCKRFDLNLATLKQVNMMIKLGMPPGQARITTFDNASEWITAHKKW